MSGLPKGLVRDFFRVGKCGSVSTDKKLSKRIEAEYDDVTSGKFEITTLP